MKYKFHEMLNEKSQSLLFFSNDTIQVNCAFLDGVR